MKHSLGNSGGCTPEGLDSLKFTQLKLWIFCWQCKSVQYGATREHLENMKTKNGKKAELNTFLNVEDYKFPPYSEGCKRV